MRPSVTPLTPVFRPFGGNCFIFQRKPPKHMSTYARTLPSVDSVPAKTEPGGLADTA